MLPQANALLTSIDAAGAPADFDQAAGAGSSVWTGAEPAYYTERRERVVRGGNSDVELRRYLTIRSAIGRLLDTGQSVTFEHAGATVVGTVQLVEVSDFAGVPDSLQTTDAVLEVA